MPRTERVTVPVLTSAHEAPHCTAQCQICNMIFSAGCGLAAFCLEWGGRQRSPSLAGCLVADTMSGLSRHRSMPASGSLRHTDESEHCKRKRLLCRLRLQLSCSCTDCFGEAAQCTSAPLYTSAHREVLKIVQDYPRL